MKKIIVILIFLIINTCYSQWEPYSWGFEPSYGIAAVFGDTLMLWTRDTSSTSNSYKISTDKGTTWQSLASLPNCTDIHTIEIKDSIIFFGGWWHLYISTNLGISWQRKENGLPASPTVNSVLAHDNKIFAGLDEGMYVSTDLGENWTLNNNGIKLKKGLNKVIILDIFAKHPNIFTSTLTGIYLSTDNGESWIPKNNDLPIDIIYFHKLEITGENIYAFELSKEWNNRIYLSTNMGESWLKKNIKFLEREILLSLKATGVNIFAATDYGLYLSKDKGDNWEYIGFSNSSKDTSVSSIYLIDDYIYANVFYKDGINKNTINSVVRAKISDFTDVKDNNELIKTIQVNPNPSSDYILIETHVDFFHISIYNFFGMKVLSVENQKKINVSSLPPGLYFCHIVTGNHSEIQKFVVIK